MFETEILFHCLSSFLSNIIMQLLQLMGSFLSIIYTECIFYSRKKRLEEIDKEEPSHSDDRSNNCGDNTEDQKVLPLDFIA